MRYDPSSCVCTACGYVMRDWAEYEEWQHDGCGGLVVRVKLPPGTAWAYCLSLFGLPRGVHVVDQHDQPYGSARRCCNRCGRMKAGEFVFVDSIADWNALPTANRCDAP